jgi:hypothetical protein
MVLEATALPIKLLSHKVHARLVRNGLGHGPYV